MILGSICMALILVWLHRYKQRHPNISVDDEAKELYAKAGITLGKTPALKTFVLDEKLAELTALNP